MSAKCFTDEQVDKLRKNPFVKRVSAKSITYTDEFKAYFIEEYRNGKDPTQILKNAGFDTKALGQYRINGIACRYKAMSERMSGLSDTRSINSGRPMIKNLTPDEKIQRLEQQIAYLKQENEFLKKNNHADKKAQQEYKRLHPLSTESSKK